MGYSLLEARPSFTTRTPGLVLLLPPLPCLLKRWGSVVPKEMNAGARLLDSKPQLCCVDFLTSLCFRLLIDLPLREVVED